jgi:PKD repeat protein
MKSSHRSVLGVVACTGLAMLGLAFTGSTSALASQTSDPGPANTVVSAVPSAITPKVNDGKVYNIAQVGNTMIIGGSFTQVNSLSRTHLAAFDKTTGALSSFAPNIDGDVNSVLPGPTSTTVYIAGTFNNVNGTPAKLLALIDFTTGALVTTFHVPVINFGPVNDMVKSGNRLYIAGAFTKVGAKPHGGIASLNATTGALDPYMNVQLAGHHNDTGSGAQGGVGPWDLAMSPNGNTLAVIGNFKTADTLLRDQVALLDISGGTNASVAQWATNRYAPYCFNWAFDSYVRGVSFSPDGSYFVVNATGGGNAGTLCDATARFETNLADSNAQPTWVDETGGDTVWAVAVTSTAIYIGGHNRWNNNPNGSDHALPGAVPRPGLAALDPVSGRPLTWNPGRNPLGTAVYAMLATPEGLWIGSNTDWIGNRKYNRPKIALFPFAGGYQPASTSTAGLPGTAYLGTSDAGGATNVLYRVDAGGPAIQSTDNGPDWAADTSDPSSVRNNGSNAAAYGPGETVDATVPATTPNAVFESERWSPSDNPAMQWAFPVAAGLPLQVRLYFANRCTCTSTAGKRIFNVKLDGNTVLNHYDIVADVGDQRGTMKAFNITSDGTVNIDFSHVTENPLINGIEIVRTDISPPPPGSGGLSTVAFDGSTGSQASVDNQGIDFGNWRGAFLVGNKVFYGYAPDSYMYSRTFVNETFGPAVKVDPYNDPTWSNIDSGDGTTFRGMVPSLYGQIPNLTGMVYSGGKVYYTLFGDSNLYSRWFSPDSGIIDERTFTSTSSVSFSDADGMFIAGGNLYYGSRSDGNLRRVIFSGGTVSGSPAVVSGPGTDGVNWKNRAMFLGAAIPINNPPSAAFTSSCGGFSCSFTSTSTDDNGIASYAWSFGDSGTSTTANPSHTYANPGTYTVQLTVTDGGGKTDTVSHDVVASAPVSTISFVGAAPAPGGNVKTKTVTVPSAAQAGDTGVLFLSRASTATWSAPSGSGWSQVATHTSGTLVTTVWTKTLGASDPGAGVTFTSATAGHTSVDLAVYRGVNTTTPVATATQLGDGGQTSHVTPNATAGSGDWVVSFWSDRSVATRTWTTPGSVTQRGATTDTGTVTMQDVIADTNGPVSSGAYGGITATTDAATVRSDMWTIVLNTN